jgi:AraC family transcriptional regulator of adaptative response / DNA-3-methyladenine glycosylase II
VRTVEVELAFQPPLCPDNLFGHLIATAVPGVEEWRDGAYRRTIGLPGGPGILAVRPPAAGSDRMTGRIAMTDPSDLAEAVRLCRFMLDLDVDPATVDGVLAGDPVLAPLVEAVPGRRVPRTTDAAEFAVRAVLGQQVSTAAARTLAARIVTAHGEPVHDPGGGLTHLFPAPAALLGLDPQSLRMPGTRRATVIRLIAAMAGGELSLTTSADPDDVREARRALAGLPGIGPWTVEVVAMRALGDPDAFPASDLGVRAAVETLGLPAGAGRLTWRSQAWRPCRAYAVQHLWAILDHPINSIPEVRSPP